MIAPPPSHHLLTPSARIERPPQPIFGPLRDKLGVITRAFFAQKDFAETEILVDFYSSLQNGMLDRDQFGESAMYMGSSPAAPSFWRRDNKLGAS